MTRYQMAEHRRTVGETYMQGIAPQNVRKEEFSQMENSEEVRTFHNWFHEQIASLDKDKNG